MKLLPVPYVTHIRSMESYMFHGFSFELYTMWTYYGKRFIKIKIKSVSVLQCCSHLFIYNIRSYYITVPIHFTLIVKTCSLFLQGGLFFFLSKAKKSSSSLQLSSASMASGWISIISLLKSSCFKFNRHLQTKAQKHIILRWTLERDLVG